jgi:hypothetical protein
MTDNGKLRKQIKHLEKYRRAVHRMITDAPSGIDTMLPMLFCCDVESLLLAKRAEAIARHKAELERHP